MQDKRNMEVDRRFVDQAWEEMRKMLDADMPVKKERRPVLWFFLLLGLITLGGGLAWFVASDEQTIKGAPAMIEKPVAEQVPADGQTGEPNAPSSGNNTGAFAQNNTTENDPLSPASSKDNGKTTVLDHTPEKQFALRQNKEYPIPPVKSEPTPKITFPSSVSEIRLIPTPEDNRNYLTAKLKSDPAPTLEFKYPETQAPVSPVATIQSIPTMTVSLTTGPELEASRVKRPRKISWEASAGVLSHELAAVDGLHGGIGAVYSLAGERWTLRSGLQYRFHRMPFERITTSSGQAYDAQNVSPENSFGNYVLSSANDFFNGVVDPQITEFVIGSSQQPINLTLKSHYLDMPLVAEYRPVPKISVGFGGRFSYLLSSFWGLSEVAATSVGTDVNSPGLSFDLAGANTNRSWYKSAADDRTDESVTRRFDVALTVGIGFYPTNHLGLRLEYDHGLKNILQSDDFRLHNRSLRISARYLFIR